MNDYSVLVKKMVKVNCVDNVYYLEMKLVKKCVIEVIFKFRVFMDPCWTLILLSCLRVRFNLIIHIKKLNTCRQCGNWKQYHCFIPMIETKIGYPRQSMTHDRVYGQTSEFQCGSNQTNSFLQNIETVSFC